MADTDKMRFVVPIDGATVRFPGSFTPLPADGAWVTWEGSGEATYWRRRVNEGSVVVVDKSISTTAAADPAPTSFTSKRGR